MDGDIRHLTELRLWEISCVTFSMNESGQVSGVKALSADDMANHRKAIDRHQRGMRMHSKSLLDLPDGDHTDDEPLLEGEDDVADKASFLAELKQLAEQAQDLASA
jgi:uncharacterized protein